MAYASQIEKAESLPPILIESQYYVNQAVQCVTHCSSYCDQIFFQRLNFKMNLSPLVKYSYSKQAVNSGRNYVWDVNKKIEFRQRKYC